MYYKTSKLKAEKEPTEMVRKVAEFYNKDKILLQLPYKKLTRFIGTSW